MNDPLDQLGNVWRFTSNLEGHDPSSLVLGYYRVTEVNDLRITMSQMRIVNGDDKDWADCLTAPWEAFVNNRQWSLVSPLEQLALAIDE